MSSPAINFLTKPEYFADLTERIAATQKGRVIVATMSFKPAFPEIQKLLHEMGEAARRGVEVTLLVDAIDFLVGPRRVPGPLFFSKKDLGKRHMPAMFQHKYDALSDLKAKGGKFIILNIPKAKISNIYAGRSHIKFAIINDLAYFGGCNLTSQEHLDVMGSWHDPGLADFLADFTQQLQHSKNHTVREVLQGQDRTFKAGSQTDVLLDSGMPGQSLIMGSALHAIDNSKKTLLITTQYFLNKTIGEHLVAASQRGVAITVIFNNPKRHQFIEGIMMRRILFQERRRLPKDFFAHMLPPDNPYLHAKLLIADDTLIIGSHNYFPMLVRYGTAELSLKIRDASIAARAKSMLLGQLDVSIQESQQSGS